MNVQSELIQIDWEGPHLLDSIESIKDESRDYGIYQIYGKHPIYGSGVLLYIGKADCQTIGKRILQENWQDTNDSQRIEVYVGRLAGDKQPSQEEWSRQITLAEQLLIYVHKPAYNSKNISSFDNAGLQIVHILNWGSYRDLFPEVSGFRWTTRLDETRYEIYTME